MTNRPDVDLSEQYEAEQIEREFIESLPTAPTDDESEAGAPSDYEGTDHDRND